MSNVQVAVRVRPLSQRELEMKSEVAVEMRNKSTILFKTVSGVAVGETRDDSREFEYDHSYWSVDSQDTHFIAQEQVFNDLGKSVLESAFQGYNACVFAYGQTGSGKTHTMMGNEDDPGLIPRICESLYAHIENGSKRNVSYKVEASYMEIYNEKVRDLLQTSTPNKTQDLHKLKVREHPKEGPYVEHLSRHNVVNFQEISKLMKIGNGHRVTASTKMNDVSSRSHAIFTIHFTQAAYSSDLPCETVSKIHLVDLAGSERASATGAEGVRLKEGGNINRSLACLGNVISALADMSGNANKGGKKVFIPYRDSVLTWLLKDSLGGNSKTIMVATISPAVANYGETLSTLRYASRAKNIVNKPIVNEDANVKLIRELRTEIKRLKGIITAAKLQDSDLIGADSLLEENIHKKEEMIAELTKNWAGKWDEGIQQLVEESNLALHSDGIKMTLASERPHLLAVDNDVFGGGVVIYHLKSGLTTIGAKEASPSPDIALTGSGIHDQHCAVQYSEEQVKLVLAEGKCYVNHQELQDDQDLSHGDLLQLGHSTVFRYNHPEEAQKLRGTADTRRVMLLPLSPISPTISDDSHDRTADDLEEQKEALEKDYNEKMERLREQLEKEKAEDRAKFLQEIESLRQQSLHTPTSDTDSDLHRNTAYELLQSIAYTPVRTSSDLSSRVVIGQEQTNSRSTSRSPNDCAHSYQSSSSSPNSSPEGLFRRKSIEQEQVDEDTLDISIVDKQERYRVDSRTEDNSGYCVVDDMGREETGNEGDVEDGGGGFSPVQRRGRQPRTSDSDHEDETCGLKLKETESKLQEKEREFEEVLEEKTAVESQLSEAHRRAHSLKHHLSEKEYELQSQQDEWEKKYQSLERKFQTKDLDSSMRERSNAMSQSETSPEGGRGRRKKRFRSQSANRSLRRSNPPFTIEVPGCLLRGEGWGSYHVYEIRIQLSGYKWSVYKSYQQFKIFRDDMVRKYSQLAVLSFPPSKWIGVKKPEFVERRRLDLQNFLQSLMAICSALQTCPLYDINNSKRFSKDKLCTFSSFFDSGTRTGL